MFLVFTESDSSKSDLAGDPFLAYIYIAGFNPIVQLVYPVSAYPMYLVCILEAFH
jgi:hypothetical protein